MKTVLQNLLNDIYDKPSYHSQLNTYQWLKILEPLLEKEKEQIQKAFSDGQDTPINHPTLPHYSRDEYYNDNYNGTSV